MCQKYGTMSTYTVDYNHNNSMTTIGKLMSY
jgi:hypothetical protein